MTTIVTTKQNRLTFAEVLETAERVEALLVQGYSDHSVKRQLGGNRFTVGRMIKLVRDRWVREGRTITRDQRKAQMREMLIEHHRQCMENKIPVPVWVSKDTQVVEKHGAPDLKAAGRVLETMCKFDGLLEQPDGGSNDLQLPLALQVAALLGITVTVETARDDARELGSGRVIDAPQGDDER